MIRTRLFPFMRKKFSIKKSYPNERYFKTEDKIGIVFTLKDKPGVLVDALNIFLRNGVNLTSINSKPKKFLDPTHEKLIEFCLDMDGKIIDQKIQRSIQDLKRLATSTVDEFAVEGVPWFPKSVSDLNLIGRQLMSANEALSADHPGFHDSHYRRRRDDIAKISNSYDIEEGTNIPLCHYTKEEKEVWSLVWDRLIPLHDEYACNEFKEAFQYFVNCGVFKRSEIPQLRDISEILYNSTKTLYRPVGGLLTQREFLNGLAFRVFHSTQYIRHRSVPFYTPEPDIIHEALGHAPLFINKDFADFSQIIGLTSLAASDDDIAKLGTIYWFTVEFGLCMQNKEKKIYGGGILSSPSEIEYSMSDKPKLLPFDIFKMAIQPYTITEMQENYFLAPSFAEMKREVLKYAETVNRPFHVTYDAENKKVDIDR